MKPILRRLLGVVLSLGLIAILLALVQKTRSIDTTLLQQVNGQLRELKQVDATWNLDILRSKIGINKNYDQVTTPLQWLQKNQPALMKAANQANESAIKQAADDLKTVINEKISLVDRFKMQNALLKNSLRFLPTAVGQLRDQIVAVTLSDTSIGINNTEQISKLEVTASEMLTELLKYNLAPDEAIKARVAGLLEKLAEAPSSTYPEQIQSQVRMIVNHAQTVLKQKESEDQVLASIDQVPITVRIDQLATQFERSFDLALQEKEQWRMALIAYSAGLLLLLAFAMIAVWRSYRSLDQANAFLEQRVEERTRDLSTALAHLRESQLQLIQSEKMASLGQMVAGIAHEINTPLAYVKGGLEILNARMGDVDTLVTETSRLMNLMTQEPQEDEAKHEQQLADQFATVQELSSAFVETETVGEVKGLLGDGLYGIGQISEIVGNLKDFSRLDRARVAEFNVNEGIASTLKIARNLVKHRRIEQQLGEVPLIRCSPSQINQVLLNLINNACQATTEETGVVTIVTRPTEQGLAIEVRDNGHGISPEHLSKIFDPFFTTKKVGEGTGLGLSIVQRIVNEHGGDIQVDSVLGVGTCFTVNLPREYQAQSENGLNELNQGGTA
ncbi:DAHL domain-containing protein [uncultured Thiothrix sp.]|uniref:DAHL domain-containing protein n=1 Tax=uncultured Thiothrix sp. TaxID=223185 RepID=UPI002606BFC5|nr:DAHL domain-containing protein [uncultured Thiothrix sp.]HMT91970.1 ATP-binding protein [Thiolinea sp.]